MSSKFIVHFVNKHNESGESFESQREIIAESEDEAKKKFLEENSVTYKNRRTIYVTSVERG